MFINSAFILYQYFIYLIFCQSNKFSELDKELINFARQNKIKIFYDTPKSAWCFFKLPFSYTFIQSEYWKVGFLNYWHFKQIPNFLLALPILCLSIFSLKTYFSSLNSANLYQFFGLIEKEDKKISDLTKNKNLFPFALHLIFLLGSSLFFMHVQVKFFFSF